MGVLSRAPRRRLGPAALLAGALCCAALPGCAAAGPREGPAAAPTAAPPAGAPPSAREEELRRTTGALALRLALGHQPPEEELRLRIAVERAGVPFGHLCELDLALRRGPSGALALRLRYREPPALRGEAWLLLEDPEGRRSAWRHDPRSGRSARATPPPWTQRVAGTGLLLGDLRGWDLPPGPARLLPRLSLELDCEGRLDGAPPPGTRLWVEVPSPAPPPALLRFHLGERRFEPLLVEELDAAGRVTRRLFAGDHEEIAGRLRWRRLLVVEPGAERVSRVEVRARAPRVPPARFDPERFARE